MNSQQTHIVDKGTVYHLSFEPGIKPVTEELCDLGQVSYFLILGFLISKMNIIVVPTYLTALS